MAPRPTIRLDIERTLTAVRRQSAEQVGETWRNIEQFAAKADPGQRLLADDILAGIEKIAAARTALDPDWTALNPSTPGPGGEFDRGLLRFWGYAVGHRGQLLSARREILDHAFRAVRLPPHYAQSYLRRWAAPESGERLAFMAHTLGAFVRDKRRLETHAVAVQEWRSDLEHLRTTYYVGRFTFPRPALR